MQLYLASQSPRRAELLNQLRLRFTQFSVDIDERHKEGEPVRDYVCRLAEEKAAAGLAAVEGNSSAEGCAVIGADTIVCVDNTILGKPQNVNEAIQSLQLLSGRKHFVLTAVSLLHVSANGDIQSKAALSSSQVTFRSLDIEEINQYCATAEPHDKAGAYAIQGLAAAFVESITGSYSGIVGLPLFETAKLLDEVGVLAALTDWEAV